MRNRLVFGVGISVIAVVVLVLALRGRSGGAGADPTPPSPSTGARIVAAQAGRTVDTLPAVQFDDDPVGALRLEGQVIDATDKPIGGATVVIDANPPRELRTEADGSFAFDQLTPRTYRIAARATGGHAGPIEVRLGQRTEPVVLRVREAARIVVTVTDEANTPIHGALVELRDLVAITETTDATGRVTLRGVGAGTHIVRASADRHASAFVAVASSGDAGAESVAKLVLHAGVSVAGTVVDTSGAPIEGARVLPEHLGTFDDVYDARFDAVLTDAKGRWRLTGLARDTTRIRAYHAAYAPGASTPLVLHDGGDRTGVTVVLDRGGRVEGRVVDKAGAAVPGAEVRISADTQLSGQVRRVAADAGGHFKMGGLPRSMVFAVGASEAATSATIAIDLRSGEPRTVELVLDRNAELAGVVVTRAGQPVPEARVVAERAGAIDALTGRIEERLRGTASVIAGSDARFRITGLDPGEYSMRAIRPGSASQLLTAKVGAKVQTGATDLRIVVDDLSSIIGSVATPAGAPVTRFAIQLGLGPLQWFTSADGKFRIDEVPTGKQYLRLSGPDFTVVPMDVAIEAGRPTDLGKVVVQPGRTLEGTVVDRDNRPVAGATVLLGREIHADGISLAPYPNRDVRQVVTNAEGRFTMRGIGPGSQQLAADHEVAGRSAMTAIPAGTADLADLAVTLRPPGVVQGFVRLHGKPAEALVVLRAGGDAANSRVTVRTGLDGSYRFDRVGPGKYVHLTLQLAAAAEGADGNAHVIEVRSGETTTLDVDLTPTGIGLVMRLSSPGDTVKYAYGSVAAVPSDLAIALPTTVGGARALATQVTSFEMREGLIVTNQQVRFTNVRPGRIIACAAPMRGDPSDPSVLAEVMHSTVDWPLYCKYHELPPAPDPGQITIEVREYKP